MSDFSRRILDGLTAQNAATAAPQTTEMAQESGEDEDTDEGNSARAQGCTYTP